MKTAKDYFIGFGYGDTDGEYYYTPTAHNPKTTKWVGYWHKGDDIYTPTGTPIVVSGKIIGLTGATGRVGGPHLHVQAGTDEWCQNTIPPKPFTFKSGLVVHTGYADEWGNYIIMKVGKVYICYAHLSQINVKTGQVIKEITMDTEAGKEMYRTVLHREPTEDDGVTQWNGKTPTEALKSVRRQKEWLEQNHKIVYFDKKVATINKLLGTIARLQKRPEASTIERVQREAAELQVELNKLLNKE